MRWAMAAAMLATAASGVDARGKRAGVQTIRYATGPCFGTCPVYRVTVSSNGRGLFEGERFTAVTGRRAFRVTPAEWRAFRDQLAALHGRGTVDLTGPPLCKVMATDMPSVEVTWSGAWRRHRLRVNYGCDGVRYGWMYSHLRRAPGALPIAAFVRADNVAPARR